MPKLSIIILTYNSAATIERCLRSICVQTFRDYEILVQDGGSRDGTVELVEGFLQENPDIRLKLEQEPDKGVYDAMNKGMRRASGEWLYFLGSDDELYDGQAFSTVMTAVNTTGCDVIYGNAMVVGECGWARSDELYDGPFDLPKLLNRNICHQAILYRTELAQKVGEYNTAYVVCADWDFNMRCWARRPFRYVNVTISKFYAGGQSSNSRPDEQFGKDFLPNLFRYFNLSLFDPLINAPDFTRFSEVVGMQKSKGPLYSIIGIVVRKLMKLRTTLSFG